MCMSRYNAALVTMRFVREDRSLFVCYASLFEIVAVCVRDDRLRETR